MPSKIDLTGRRFGRLTVVSEDTNAQGSNIRWNCVCDCGAMRSVMGCNLSSGRTSSCGCSKATVNGLSSEPEHHIWRSMKGRCSNENNDAFPIYGGRGITVCDRWKDSFLDFYSDMGPRPTPEHTLERDNTNGNYEPSNCRWATMLEQQNNRRNNVVVNYNNQDVTLSELSRMTGIGRTTLDSRIKLQGLSVEEAVRKTKP